jgi:hypothetical protein
MPRPYVSQVRFNAIGQSVRHEYGGASITELLPAESKLLLVAVGAGFKPALTNELL